MPVGIGGIRIPKHGGSRRNFQSFLRMSGRTLTRGKKRGKFFSLSLNPAIFLASGCGATVAHQLPKLRVAGSNPVARSNCLIKFHFRFGRRFVHSCVRARKSRCCQMDVSSMAREHFILRKKLPTETHRRDTCSGYDEWNLERIDARRCRNEHLRFA
jgi:hypothetical protein